MKHEISEMVWPVENYTDKIWVAVKYTVLATPWLSFTVGQIVDRIRNGYPWLTLDTERQQVTLAKLVAKAMGKMVQQSLAVRVKGPTTVETTWQAVAGLTGSGYKSVTSEDSVAHTPEALKACKRRSIGGRSLWKLNNLKPA